jgi:D-3-phosphoglycerate dehydrogenase
MINADFLKDFKNPLWLLNTARGKCVVTEDLVAAMKEGKVLGAGLDVLEYEKKSFEDMFGGSELPEAFTYLIKANNVLLTPHVAGWTVESKIKLAQTVVDKIKEKFC